MNPTTTLKLRDTFLAYASSLPNESFAEQLPSYVRSDVIHNGKAVGLSGYVDIIKGVLQDYPAGADHIPMLLVDEQHQTIAARVVLRPDSTAATRGVRPMVEHVFYQYHDGKVKEVWSMAQELQS